VGWGYMDTQLGSFKPVSKVPGWQSTEDNLSWKTAGHPGFVQSLAASEGAGWDLRYLLYCQRPNIVRHVGDVVHDDVLC